jgi:hypothetical protein
LRTTRKQARRADRERSNWLHPDRRIRVDSVSMNDFHIAILWLRSLELAVGNSAVTKLTKRDLHDLFVRYRSPYKA